MEILNLKATHWEAVRAIFIDGIQTKNATFMLPSEVPSWKGWTENHLSHSRFVAIKDSEIIGWSALSPYSKKVAYRGVVEVSVYIKLDKRGSGLGKLLLERLVKASEENNIWTLQSRIYPENKASLHIHKACGFKVLGTMKKAAQIDGIWRDVIILERRSEIVGN
ncbi:MAG: N-acetyltransferase [Flavobacteriaceae bacterium]|nr:N-acetyltransferase [Flavobacteriaceae bacterium]